MKEEVSTGQHSIRSCGGEELVVSEPGHLSCRPAVWRSAGHGDVLPSLHRLVHRLLLKAPGHLWKHSMCAASSTFVFPVCVLLFCFTVICKKLLTTEFLQVKHMAGFKNNVLNG